MQICRTLAGYSYAQADIVRRAMSKKKSEVMEQERVRFVDGARSRNIDKNAAEEIFDEMVGFAKYAFNKSHATVYAITSYRTAYLKCHFPADYYSALMSSVLNQQDKIREYIEDAKESGVRVLPPDVNFSGVNFSASNGVIYFGLLAIKNVGKLIASAIVEERKKRPFKSFEDFVSRMADKDMNKRALEFLIKGGVFDSLGRNRRVLLDCYENILEHELEKLHNNITGQMDFFSLMLGQVGTDDSTQYPYPDVPDFSFKELLAIEKESLGMYFSGHLLDDYSENIRALEPDSSSAIINSFEFAETGSKYSDRSQVALCGVISSIKTKSTKNGETMATFVIDDKLGELEVICFPRVFAKYENQIFSENAVYIVARLSMTEEFTPRLIASEIEPLVCNREYHSQLSESQKHINGENGNFKKEEPRKNPRLFIRVASMADYRISSVEKLARMNPGTIQIVFYDMSLNKYSAFKNCSISFTDTVKNHLYRIFDEENVIFIE